MGILLLTIHGQTGNFTREETGSIFGVDIPQLAVTHGQFFTIEAGREDFTCFFQSVDQFASGSCLILGRYARADGGKKAIHYLQGHWKILELGHEISCLLTGLRLRNAVLATTAVIPNAFAVVVIYCS